ncbi:pyridoxamine 5'-phosphate oxidase [Russula earlei]|uniref:Pyridoxamine 5'-phosphate oxidase n=1 Tax=Russula earlei TaxID=71964 RepID=A0ACC0TU67_9AGAM|nr:pyridoxamine 5'-phosphate oxidase [Russula earlei]
MDTSIAGIRTDYKLRSLTEADVAANPFEQFTRWWQEAVHSKIEEVNAMTLATATKEGQPSARIVLLKGYDNNGFTFFTNYDSQKGNEMAENPHIALVFFWRELERQVRIEGLVKQTSAAISDEYFFSRPAGSRIGAWSSPQSKVIESREVLEEKEQQFIKQFGENIPRPPHWGGYVVAPRMIEFWQGRSNRLHDRIQYRVEKDNWRIVRLAP